MKGKTIGNLILMTLVCVVIFIAFMALRPARALDAGDVIAAMPDYKIDQMEKEGIALAAKRCANEWGTDYGMQLYCRNKEATAARTFYATSRALKAAMTDPSKEKDARVLSRIMHRCFEEWPAEYSMVLYCFKKGANAYKTLQEND
jgi:hypothetical protein